MKGARDSNQVLLVAYLDRYVEDIPHRMSRVYKIVGPNNIQLCMF